MLARHVLNVNGKSGVAAGRYGDKLVELFGDSAQRDARKLLEAGKPHPPTCKLACLHVLAAAVLRTACNNGVNYRG